MALKKLCNKSGCKSLCDLGIRFCNEHSYVEEQNNSLRNKQYDNSVRFKRDKKYTEFYHSPEWEATRLKVLSKYNSLDLYAYYIRHEIVTATTVHHIVELKEDWDMRLSIPNLFPISDSNHKVIEARYKKDKYRTQKMLRDLLIRWEREMSINGRD